MKLRDGELILRPWTEDDVPAIIEGCNDAEIAYWIPTIPHPYTEEDARAFLRGEVAPGHEAMAVVLGGRIAGGIGLGLSSRGYRASIGYWIAAPVRGRGICTRALRLLSRHALEELELPSVQLTTDPENVASQRVAEKVGFRREGVLRAHMRHPGRTHPRLGDVLAATRRASRVTTPRRGRSGRLPARADGGRARRAAGVS